MKTGRSIVLLTFALFLLFIGSCETGTTKNYTRSAGDSHSWLDQRPFNGEVYKNLLQQIDGRLRPSICIYDSNQLIAKYPVTLKPHNQGFGGKVKTDTGIWDVQLIAGVSNEKGQLPFNISFELESGQAEHAGVALVFDFSNWSEHNYVFVPSAAYNGNRFQVLKMPYPPFFYDKKYQRVDLPVTITDVPRLSKNPGLSKMELLTTDAATPAAGFCNPDTGDSFLLLMNEKTPYGPNGIIIEENEGRSFASLVISAPGVRTRQAGGTMLRNSDDRGASFKPDDRVSLDFILNVFHADNIPGFLKYFFIHRKALSGENQLVQRTPFSTAFNMEEAIQNNERWFEKGQYYKNGNGDTPPGHMQIGWVGGLMQPYPLMLGGSEKSFQRSLATLKTAFDHVQGPSGFFYGIYKDGVLYGDDFAEARDKPYIAMVRKNADALYYLTNEFDLLKSEGKATLIKVKEQQGLRKLADAFVQLWDHYGQFGQFVNVETGELIVGGSTAGAMAPAGLALAARYFDHDHYLQVAREAAEMYYQRDVLKGYTSGGPGEILQNPDSESAIALLTSLMTLYDCTGEKVWLNHAEDMAALFSSWVVSYDFEFPENSALAKCKARSAGAVWASTQNKHAAPGACTSSCSALLKLYRATGNEHYLSLLRDISHNILEFMSTKDRPVGNDIGGYINERVNISDWEGKDAVGNLHWSSVSWCELAVLLTTVEIPGIYVVPDKNLIYTFDHVSVKKIGKDQEGLILEISNPTPYDASVSVLAENSAALKKPLPDHLFRHMTRVEVKHNVKIKVQITKEGTVIVKN